jgi:hypothetical protein
LRAKLQISFLLPTAISRTLLCGLFQFPNKTKPATLVRNFVAAFSSKSQKSLLYTTESFCRFVIFFTVDSEIEGVVVKAVENLNQTSVLHLKIFSKLNLKTENVSKINTYLEKVTFDLFRFIFQPKLENAASSLPWFTLSFLRSLSSPFGQQFSKEQFEKIFIQLPPFHPALLYEEMGRKCVHVWSNMTFETQLWIGFVSSVDRWIFLKQISKPSDSALNCIKTVVSKYLFLFFESAKIGTAELTSLLLKTATESSASMHFALQTIKTLCELVSNEFIVSTIIHLRLWAQPNRTSIFLFFTIFEKIIQKEQKNQFIKILEETKKFTRKFSKFKRKTFYTSSEFKKLLKIEG